MAEEPQKSSGVQDLIARIRDEGVQAGKQEADTLLAEAQRKAAQVTDQARARCAIYWLRSSTTTMPGCAS